MKKKYYNKELFRITHHVTVLPSELANISQALLSELAKSELA